MKGKFPFQKQLDAMDCGPTCLRMIASHYGKTISREFLREKSNITNQGVTLGGIANAAEAVGMDTMAASISIESLLTEVPLPCIAYWKQRHFVVVYKTNKNKVFVADPAHDLILYSVNDFVKGWADPGKQGGSAQGVVLILEPTHEFYKTNDSEAVPKGFKFLIPYFRPYLKIIFQLVAGLFAASIIQLIFPFLTQAIVDYGINFQNISFIYLILVAQITLFTSQTAVQGIRSWLLMHMTSRLNIKLISSFLIKIMNLPMAFFDSKNVGDILQRIQDHGRIQNFLSATSLNFLFSLINIIIFGAVLAYYNLHVFITFMVGASLYVIWTLIFLSKRKEIDYKQFDQAAGNQSSIIQLINGMQEIKLNGSERKRRWEWEAIQLKVFKLSLKGLSLSQAQTIGGGFINELKNILITFISAKAVIDGQLTLGMMLSVQYVVGQLNFPISNFITFIQSAQDAKISLERLSEIHGKDDEESKQDTFVKELPENRNIIVNQVSFRYGGKSARKVIDNLQFEIPSGKITAIVGASGSGKTTLVKMFLKFYKPEIGKIMIGDVDLENISSNFWRMNCGVVMQDGYIFADTIIKNIIESEQGELINKEKLERALKIANLNDFIQSLPLGLQTKIGASGINVSGGQKQRILIARSIYKEPKYIFFDEATSSLDANNERIIMENLYEFFKGRTVVVVAHRLSTVKNADKIIVLNNGIMVESGNHSELIENRSYYFTLVKNQLELGN